MRSIQASLQLTLSKPEPCQDRVCQAHGLPAPWAVGTRQSPPRQEPNAARAGEWGSDHRGGKHPCCGGKLEFMSSARRAHRSLFPEQKQSLEAQTPSWTNTGNAAIKHREHKTKKMGMQ